MDDQAEEFWLACNEPLALLRAIHPVRTLGSVQPQTRASRMYLLACARQLWLRLPPVSRTLVVLGEMVADTSRKRERLRAAVAPVATRLMQSPGEYEDLLAADSELTALQGITSDLVAARRAASKPAPPAPPIPPDEWRGLAALIQLPFEENTPAYHWVSADWHSIDLLREVYGNPYRNVAFKECWRTRDVVEMAIQVYSRGDFGAMPILADALQDAGCDSDDLLGHCRAQMEHVRGCWVLDQVLKLR